MSLKILKLLSDRIADIGKEVEPFRGVDDGDSHDYTLWRIGVEVALKGKGYWWRLTDRDAPTEIKEKGAAFIVAALADPSSSSLQVRYR